MVSDDTTAICDPMITEPKAEAKPKRLSDADRIPLELAALRAKNAELTAQLFEAQSHLLALQQKLAGEQAQKLALEVQAKVKALATSYEFDPNVQMVDVMTGEFKTRQ